MVERSVHKHACEAKRFVRIRLGPPGNCVQAVAQRTCIEAEQVARDRQPWKLVGTRPCPDGEARGHSITIGGWEAHRAWLSRVHPVAMFLTGRDETASGAHADSPKRTRRSRERLYAT